MTVSTGSYNLQNQRQRYRVMYVRAAVVMFFIVVYPGGGLLGKG